MTPYIELFEPYRPGGVVRAAKAIRCASCKKRIRPHQPDLVLEDVAGGGKVLYYHATCGGAAYAAAARRPSVYVLTVRHVDSSRN